MKFKCKLCHKKHKISSLANASKEINCTKIACPLKGGTGQSPNIGTSKEEDFLPREGQLLEFDEFGPEPFAIVTSWETPEKPKIIIQNQHYPNDPNYNGWC